MCDHVLCCDSAHVALSRLLPLLSSLDMSNPTDERLFENLALIRSRFKTLIVMMGVHTHFKRQHEQETTSQGLNTQSHTPTQTQGHRKPDMSF